MGDLTVITGSSGFIGRRLQADLQGRGWEVVGWSREMGDLRDTSATTAALADLRPSRIFHLAAGPAEPAEGSFVRVADEQQMLSNLVYGMRSHCRLIYTGSMAEYGRAGTFGELDQCAPSTVYGCAKYACTTLAIALGTALDRDIRAARLFGVYGPGERMTRLLPALIQRLAKGEPVPLSDGAQVRDFIHVDDVVNALVALACADSAPPIVNVGTGVGVTVRAVCEATAIALGVDCSLLRFGELPRRAVDEHRLVAKIGRLQTIIEPPIQRWNYPELTAQSIAEFMASEGFAESPSACQPVV